MDSYLIYIIARIVIAAFRAMPRSISIVAIRFMADCVYFLDSGHRRIAMTNLKIAFPEKTEHERKWIARKSFQNVGLNLLEISRISSLDHSTISSLVEYDEVDGIENYRIAASQGKGILYLTGHFSAWELLPIAHALHGYPLSFITRPLDNAPLEKLLLSIRESKGNKVIYKKESARKILRELADRGGVGILMDHNTSLQEGMFVDFFGVPAATTSGIALFALRTDAPVLPGYLTPLRNGKYRIKFLPPISVVRTGDRAQDLEANTKIFNQVLEKIIREQPEAWLWGHKRWKNQPAGNPDIYRLSPQDLEAFLRKYKDRGNASHNASA